MFYMYSIVQLIFVKKLTYQGVKFVMPNLFTRYKYSII